MTQTHPILSILHLWPSRQMLADDLGLDLFVIHRWFQRKSIPPEYDLRLLDAASNRNIPLLWRDLMEAREIARGLAPRKKPSLDQRGHNQELMQGGK
jgi:hypothetical protein